ncbi:Stf0 family sulfotransferase [Mesorhizobium sp. NPDC059054]|uniref:Stf0 family sulfotransferase n=1 Tax=Mesorhizobium sp. NPDC059054 TaxID=3346711 RepID=UPI00367AD4D5
MQFSSYIICGTPRSGSTLLCTMLTETRVAGRPHSYFRQQDIAEWAQEWGVEPARDPDDAQFDRDYVAAMRRAGTDDTGTFGLRLMWVSVAEASRRLDNIAGDRADITARLEETFGPTLYIHLSRLDKVAQAVSLIRAQQSGLWHRNSDGTVLEGEETPRPVAYDGEHIGRIVKELEEDDACWADFFKSRGIDPLRLTYETMSADPQLALSKVLSALGKDPELAKAVRVGTAKLADGTSSEWTARFRKESGRLA